MRATIALVALVAGCEPTSHECPGGWVCPAELACAAAPVYCGVGEQVDKCAGKADWDACEYETGDPASGSCRAGVCEMCTSDREGCAGPTTGWFAMTSPASGDLLAVTVVKQGEAYAVGQGGTLIGYDGTRWAAITTDPPLPASDLGSVWASSSDDIYVVSKNATDGVMHIGAQGALTHVTMPAGADVITAIAGSGSNDVFAVGLSGTIAHYDGTAWTLEHGGSSETFEAVSSGADPIAVGTVGKIATRSGTMWTVAQPLPCPLMTASLAAVWHGASAAVCVGPSTSGASPPPLAVQTGAGWMVPALANLNGRKLYGVLGTPEAVYAVGDLGLILRSTDLMTWDQAPSITQNNLNAVSGSGAHDIIAVGRGGVILRSVGD
jgi:hypothetical protein